MTTNRRCRWRSHRTRLRSSLGSSLWSSAAAVCLVAACGVLSLEEQVLLRFFEASRVYDKAALEKVATVAFNPVTDGIVDDFAVAGVEESADRRVVTVDAQVRRQSGTTAERLTVTMERRAGRWLITGVTRPRASQTSRGASSAPPY